MEVAQIEIADSRNMGRAHVHHAADEQRAAIPIRQETP
jgi:hypothetical protein